MSLAKKFVKHVKDEGLFKSINHSLKYLEFIIKIKVTTVRLKLLSLFKKPPISIKHGRYKFNFTNDSDYEEILYHAHWQKYFHVEQKIIKPFIKAGDIVIDIGANMGLFTLLLSDLIGDHGKVYSFEPASVSFKKLNDNIKLNNLKNTETFNFALGEMESEIEMFLNPQQSGLSSLLGKLSNNCISEKIKMTTLNNFSNRINKPVSLIKLDTEGYEPEVLKGGLNFLERYKPVLYIELGGRYQESSHLALKILKKLNYHCSAYSIDLSSIPEGTNFIAIPNGYREV